MWGSIIVNRIGKATHFVVRNVYLMIIYQKTISWNEVTKPVSKDFFDVIPLEILYYIGWNCFGSFTYFFRKVSLIFATMLLFESNNLFKLNELRFDGASKPGILNRLGAKVIAYADGPSGQYKGNYQQEQAARRFCGCTVQCGLLPLRYGGPFVGYRQ